MIERPFLRWFGHFVVVMLALTSAALGADFTGKVQSPDGKPVKGATVYLVNFGDGGDASPGARAALPTTRTDEDGAFHFPRGDSNYIEFVATADGFGASSRLASGVTPTLIRLRPRTDLTVTLIDADKNPVMNLGVSVQEVFLPIQMVNGLNNNVWIPAKYQSPWSTTTDKSGACVIRGLPQGGRVMLRFDDERYAELSFADQITLSADAETRARPIQLQLAASISGRVFYESTSKPAAGAGVHLRASEGQRDMVTGTDGSYVFNRLRADRYDICVNLDGEAQKSWTSEAGARVIVAAGESRANVNFPLIAGVILSGQVLSADDSKPVAGVALGIYGPSHPRTAGIVQSVTTGADGSFSVRVPPGAQSVDIMSDSPANGFAKPLDDEKTVTIPAGGTASVEFRLPRSKLFSVKGKVVDPDGKPVANADVSIYYVQRSNTFNENTITTGADGTFQTAPIADVEQISIRAQSGGMASPKEAIVHRRDGGEVVIQLQKNVMGTVTGRVLDQDGKPLKNAELEYMYSVGRFRMGVRAAPTDDQGNYKIESLWPDLVYEIQAYKDGYGTTNSGGVQAAAGQSTSVADLKLYRKDSAIAGVLLDGHDKPVSGKRILVRGARSGFGNLTTDVDGKFRCAVVADDRLTISYNFNMGRSKQQTVKAGDENIVLHTTPRVVVQAPPPPPPVVVAAPPPPPAPVAAAPQAAPEPAPHVYDPSDAVTWNGWLYAIVGVIVGGVVTVIVNAIVAIRGRGRTV